MTHYLYLFQHFRIIVDNYNNMSFLKHIITMDYHKCHFVAAKQIWITANYSMLY